MKHGNPLDYKKKGQTFWGKLLGGWKWFIGGTIAMLISGGLLGWLNTIFFWIGLLGYGIGLTTTMNKFRRESFNSMDGGFIDRNDE